MFKSILIIVLIILALSYFQVDLQQIFSKDWWLQVWSDLKEFIRQKIDNFTDKWSPVDRGNEV